MSSSTFDGAHEVGGGGGGGGEGGGVVGGGGRGSSCGSGVKTERESNIRGFERRGGEGERCGGDYVTLSPHPYTYTSPARPTPFDTGEDTRTDSVAAFENTRRGMLASTFAQPPQTSTPNPKA